MQKPKNIYLFGVDMEYGTSTEYMQNEKANVEYWLGMATGRKIQYHLSNGCSLMRRKTQNNYYGMIVNLDEQHKTLRLTPDYKGNDKCALKYKLIKIEHNL